MKKLLFVGMVISMSCLAACKKDVIANKAIPKPKGEVTMAVPAVAYDYQKAIEVKRTLSPGLSK